MKYKKVLLVVFLLAMFINQQAQAAKTTPSVENPSQNNSASADTLYNYVSVNMYHLSNPGGQLKDNPPKKCWTLGYIDPEFGCGTGDPLHTDIAQNPVTFNKEDLEKYYLKDVLSREMDVSTNDPTLAALRAQAIASRTVATWKAKYLPDPYNDDPNYSQIINNSTDYQVYDPGAYDTYLNPRDSAGVQQMISTAISSTTGQYLSAGGYVIDTEFGSDMLGGSDDGGQSYLKPVDDPISTTCGAGNNSTRQGMSQLGAIRWSKGNQCAGNGDQPWPVKWNDYRQILAHYYTGIDILNGSGTKIAPDDRWNLLNITNTIPSSGVMVSGQPYTFTFTLQNTSTSDWANNDVVLGWQWTPSCGTATQGVWQGMVPLDGLALVPPSSVVAPGQTIEKTVTITAPPNGTYLLHVDVKRQNGNWFQFQTPKWPDVEIPMQVGSMATPPVAGAGFYPYGLTGCYYNDSGATYQLDKPITWDTFTNFVTAIPGQLVRFSRPTSSSPAPSVQGTYWSARWVGKLNVVQADTYTFYLHNLDDGGRIYLDHINAGDTPIVESWLVQGPNYDHLSPPIYLNAGLHDIRIDYAQGPASNSSLFVQWSSNQHPTPVWIPRSAPSPTTVTISGNAGVGGTVLNYIDGTAKAVTVDANGNYSLVVSYGWTGTITPSLAGYTFTPASMSHLAVSSDQMTTAPDYTPVPVPIGIVTSSTDSGSGSLRAVLASAAPGATIIFASNLSGGTIRLSSELSLTKNVTIDGSALAVPITISGDTDNNGTADVQVFRVNSGVTATLNRLTITKGKSGIYNSGMLTVRNSTFSYNSASTGGGIYNGGTLTVTNSTFSYNSATTSGGGIYNNAGVLTVASSTFSNNVAGYAGGGIYNFSPSQTVMVLSSTFSDNSAATSGGGINTSYSTLPVMVMYSTFSRNSASQGGGIYNGVGVLTVANSTLSGNSATTSGGGIFNYDNAPKSDYMLTVRNSTFSGNSAVTSGGGIYNNGVLNYANTILANSTSGGDCFTTRAIGENVKNLVEDGSCSSLLFSDPNLGALSDNGGSTQTMALLPGSPALNAGDDFSCEDVFVNNLDQRGVTRQQGNACDIGAFEVDVAPPVINSIARANSNPTNLASVNFIVTFSELVIGVDLIAPFNDFTITPSGGVTGTTVTNVSGTGSTYTVTVNTGHGNGTIRLDVPDTATITDLAGNPLSGLPYMNGETYTIDKTPVPLPSPWVGSVSVTSNKNVVAVGRPHIGSEIASYDGFSAGALTAYLPMLFKNAFSGTYNSAFYVQNVNPATTANITIKYYDSSGVLSCTVNDTVAPLASKGYWLPDLSAACLPYGWVGGVVVTSNQPIVAIGRPHIGAEVMTYNGFSSGSFTSYLMMLFKDANGGSYDSAFYVQNVGAASATLTIKYYDLAGALTCTVSGETIAPFASKGYWLPGLAATCLPVGWTGSVVVTSTQSIVTVGRAHVGSQITTYNGFSAGSTSSYVPMLFKNAYTSGSYDAAFYIQNVNPSTTANLNIKYYDLTGTLTCTVTTDTIAPLASKGYWLPTLSAACLPDGWVGGAVVTSNVDIVAIGRPHIGAQVMTYNGFTAGSLSSYLPMLFKDAFANGSYDSAFYIQNTESTAATVITKFYDNTGALTCTRSDTLAGFSTLSLWSPSLTCVP
jgi:predicted outer membrane repeat protein